VNSLYTHIRQSTMPIRIENKEMRRVKDMQAMIWRMPDTNSSLGQYKNPLS